ncbi:hypothetical protein [uncultured Polaribacter sp.]|uniref:hypothetical protein n=1 Tax=uncultured Polaribacter sp. TaxID=174711 RepID=UPI0026093017|nr:hypothetical protein [uncultured Polaribacter sp.]
MFKNLKITCDEATTICDKNQYGEATFYEKLTLNIHFIKCKVCFLYTKQNNTLSKILKHQAKDCKGKSFTLQNEEKEILKKKLKQTDI